MREALMKRCVQSALVLVLAAMPMTAAAEDRGGFYFRLGVGGGYSFGTLAGPVPSDTRGANVATQLAAGWSIRPGIVVGIGAFPMVVPAPDYDGVDAGGQHVSGTGPFLDYYPDPRGGLHVQGAWLVTAGYLDGGDRAGNVGIGFGATVGAGYEVHISDRWSLGGIVRATAYWLYGVDDSIRLISPALLVAVTRR